jgi:hypothetical protein
MSEHALNFWTTALEFFSEDWLLPWRAGIVFNHRIRVGLA